MSTVALRDTYPWLPGAGQVWNIEAGVYWDAVRVAAVFGRGTSAALGGACGAVILDAWSQTMYFLVDPSDKTPLDIPEAQRFGTATYVTVPSLRSAKAGPHWLRGPDFERLWTPLDALQAALRRGVTAIAGPRAKAGR
ncbi:hypothetical protein [Streptomyces sp. ICBB 8177]|uniref:hypothetical protein n=1 Tax=Streptomyces sp. ICBB 8177 TaxID=563922 RepID=UPI000D67A222|nr:hypothetical protein [Streptomyces sp. ICBB 8177]PWI45954.1 hypothetical protein CK485_02080 [Streptomyces sp. ICBB 8177]